MIILFEYCVDVENILFKKNDNDEFEFKLDLLEKYNFTHC